MRGSLKAWAFAASAALLSAGAAGPGVVSAVEPRSAVTDDRPNIVVIMTDDQTVADLRVMKRTKQLLVDQGTRFDASISPFPLCCPARASFLTGQYAHNHGVMDNHSPHGGFGAFDDTETLPVWMQRAGYSTIMLGKYLNDYGEDDPTYVPPGWTEWKAPVAASTYNYYDTMLNEDGVLKEYPGWYQTDLWAWKAERIIPRYSGPDAPPFFIWANFLAPHGGLPVEPDDPQVVYDFSGPAGTPVVPPRFHDAYAGTPIPRHPNFNEADVSDKPRHVRDVEPLGQRRIDIATEQYQQRLESLLAVDQAVQRIVDALAASGELRNTVLVFTSDNGFLEGEHRLVSRKIMPYEESLRVPLIIRGPGVPQGAVRHQVVGTIDLAPTILQLAEATPGLTMDGRSLLPLIADPRVAAKRSLLVQAGPRDATTDERFYTGVRTPRFLYVRYDTGERELYDLKNDPWQLRSKHAAPAYAPARQRLNDRLAVLQDCAGTTCQSAQR